MPVTRTKSRRIAPKSSEAVVQTCSASLSKLDYMHHANHGNKWMLFPKLEEVTRVWKHVVEGVINDRLSPTAKVAPDEGKPGDRLICIYTKDFRDEDDVLRILHELETMGLVNSGRSIYYKSDAFTYLDPYKQTAAEYGLQASLYTSFKMMAAAKVAKATPLSGNTVSGKTLPGKKQKSLNGYF